jgi:hypothetical protein
MSTHAYNNDPITQKDVERTEAHLQALDAEQSNSPEAVEARKRKEFLSTMEGIVQDESLSPKIRERAVSLLDQIHGYTELAESLVPLSGGVFMGTVLVFSEVPQGYENATGRELPVNYLPRNRMGPGVGGEPVFAAALYVPVGEGVNMKERLVQFLQEEPFASDLSRVAGRPDIEVDQTRYLEYLNKFPPVEAPRREDMLAEQAEVFIAEMAEVIDYLHSGTLPEGTSSEEMQKRVQRASANALQFSSFLYLFINGKVSTAKAPPIESL